MASATTPGKLSYSIREASRATGMSPTKLRGKITNGDIPARQDGGRLYILAEDLSAMVRDLPTAPKSKRWGAVSPARS